MLREEKTQIINKLADDLSRSTIIIATNYQGLTAKQMDELRNTLAKADTEYHVVRNTLTRFAADKADREHIVDIIEGPVALAFGHGDVVNPARVLSQYIKSTESTLQIRGALLGERVLAPEEVLNLVSLPPTEVLISQLIAGLQATIVRLHNVLNSPLQGLLNVLQSRSQKLSE
ncbi:MAG: 50S ribosomal protein L10 [Dehalococcoidia bacterium]|nr:50S ribosomal protein L10 [Dehalococcoidia bacterium]